MSLADEIDRNFTYQAPSTPAVAATHTAITEEFRLFAHKVAALTPGSAEQTLALRCLQEARMWANTAVALDQFESPAL